MTKDYPSPILSKHALQSCIACQRELEKERKTLRRRLTRCIEKFPETTLCMNLRVSKIHQNIIIVQIKHQICSHSSSPFPQATHDFPETSTSSLPYAQDPQVDSSHALFSAKSLRNTACYGPHTQDNGRIFCASLNRPIRPLTGTGSPAYPSVGTFRLVRR